MIRRCEFKLVFDLVRRSGVGKDLEGILVPSGTGRPRQLTAEVFITGAVLAASKGLTLTLDNIHRVLTVELSKSLQVVAGVRASLDSEPITIRQVRYLLEAIDRRFSFTKEQDPTLTEVEREIRSEALQSIIDNLINATFPSAMPKQTSIAVDSSGVESWSKSRYAPTAGSDEADVLPNEVVEDEDAPVEIKKHSRAQRQAGKGKKEKSKKAKRERICHDPDAHGGYRTMTYDNKSNKFTGYDLFASVGVAPVGTPNDLWPKVLLAMTLSSAAGDVAAPALGQFDRLISSGHPIDEVIVDRGFSYKTPEHWANELLKRGISQVQDIHPLDQGVRDFEGMRVIAGVPHCVRMPDRLIIIARPGHFKVGPLKKQATPEAKLNHERNTRELAEFHANIAERERWASVRNQGAPEGARDPGKSQWICAGKAGKIECSLCPMGKDFPEGTPVVLNPPALDTAPQCCTQETRMVPGAVTAKLRQKDYWGSEAFCESFSRRSCIEGIFGNLRNSSTQNIKRSFCRVSGLVKTSLMLTFEVVAANIRLVRQWAKRNQLTADPLCAPMPEGHGFEELDAHGQISFTELSFLDDPPGDLAA